MTADAPGARARLWQGFGRWRRRFRRWRRGRPFWGGLFLILGGVQLFLSTQLSLLDVEISFGPEGFLVVLLPAVLLLCGILLWATPQHRFFYSVIGILTAIYSLLGLNLGGWFLGLLLGVVGGSLGFGWTPVAPAPDRPGDEPPATDQPGDERPTAELPPQPPQPPDRADSGPLLDQPPDQHQTAPVHAPRPDPHRYATLAAPLLLTAALAAPVLPAANPADHCPIPIPVLCAHDPTPSPAPEPGPSPAPTPGPTGTPPPGPVPGPTPTGAPGPGPTAAPTPTPTPTPIPTLEPPPDQPLVSARPARLTADRLTQENFRFEGITELPTAAGPIRVLQFSFSRSVATNFALAPSHDGQTTLITADPLVISGDVAFYTSRFVGRLFGVLPLELTPDSPLVDLLELVGIPLPVIFTGVDLDLVFTSGARLTATGFGVTLP